jgi:hypothetical protein
MNLSTPTTLLLFAKEHHGELLKQAAEERQARGNVTLSLSGLLGQLRLLSPWRLRPLNP